MDEMYPRHVLNDLISRVHLWMCEHPRRGRAIKIFSIYMFFIIAGANAAHAVDMTQASDNPNSFFLPVDNLHDSHGVQVGKYSTLPLDRGDTWTFDKTILGTVIDLLWAGHYFYVVALLALVHWILSFSWLGVIMSPIGTIASQIQILAHQLGFEPLALTATALAVCISFFFLKRRGAAIAELVVVLCIAVLMIGPGVNLVDSLQKPTDSTQASKTFEEQDGAWFDKALRWGQDLGESIYYRKDGAVPSHQVGQDGKDQRQQDLGKNGGSPADKITASLVDMLLREPSQAVVFGANLDHKCGDKFTEEINKRDPNDVPEKAMREAIYGDGRCKDTEKFVTTANWFKIAILLSFAFETLGITVLMLAAVWKIIQSVFDACFSGIKAMISAWKALFPLVDRSRFFADVINTVIGAAMVGVYIGLLIVYLYLLEEYKRQTQDWPVVLKSMVVAIIVVIMAVKLIQLFHKAKASGSTLSQRLSNLGLRGSTKSTPARFPAVAPAASGAPGAPGAAGGRDRPGGGYAGGYGSPQAAARFQSARSGLRFLSRPSRRHDDLLSQKAYDSNGKRVRHAQKRYEHEPTQKQYARSQKQYKRGNQIAAVGAVAGIAGASPAVALGSQVIGQSMVRRSHARAERIEQAHGKPTIMVKDGKGWVEYQDKSRPQSSKPAQDMPDRPTSRQQGQKPQSTPRPRSQASNPTQGMPDKPRPRPRVQDIPNKPVPRPKLQSQRPQNPPAARR